MKKILAQITMLVLLCVITFSLIGCGGGENTASEPTNASSTSASLVEVTSAEGISLKIPSEWVLQDNGVYIDKNTGENVAFSVVDATGNQISNYTEETISNSYQGTYEKVAVKSFENGLRINGKEALKTQVNLTSDNKDYTLILVIVTDDTKNYLINFTCESGNTEGLMANTNNLQTCIDSITIE